MDDEDLTVPASNGDEDDATLAAAGVPTVRPQAGLSGSNLTFGTPANAAPHSIASTTHLKVGETIAQGGMGAILEASDEALERMVAMKVMLPGADASPGARERFLREAIVLARLEHPNIVPIHELGRDEADRPFYTMKLVKGRTLQAIISEIAKGDEQTITDFPLNRLLTIFRQICDAMAFAHHRGVLHRDLKPENIMIGEFGETLVMDWGLAKLLEGQPEIAARVADEGSGAEQVFADLLATQNPDGTDLTMAGAVMGSPKYMAPEQAAGNIDQLDQRTDIYSLGGILYALLILHAPVSGSSVQEVLGNVRSGNITPPTEFNTGSTRGSSAGSARAVSEPSSGQLLPHCPGGRIPDALSAVTMRAVQLEASGRYQSVADLSEDIEMFQGGFATSVEDLGALRQFGMLVARHKAASIAIVASLLVIVCLTAFYLVDVTQKEQIAQENFQRAETNANLALAESKNATNARLEAEGAANELRRTLTLNYFNRGVDLLEGDEGSLGLAFLARALRTDTNYWPAATRIATALQQRAWPLNLVAPLHLEGNIDRMQVGPRADTVWLFEEPEGLELWDLEQRKALLKIEGKVDKLVDGPRKNLVWVHEQDSGIQLWDIDRNERMLHLEGDPKLKTEDNLGELPPQIKWTSTLISHGHSVEFATACQMENPILEIVLSPDGQTAWTSDIGCNQWLWNLSSGQPIIKTRPGSTIGGWGRTHVEKEPFTGATYSHDGKFAVVWSNRRIGWEVALELRDGQTGELIREPFKVGGRLESIRFVETAEVPRLLFAEVADFPKTFSIDPWAGELAVPIRNVWGHTLGESAVSQNGRLWVRVINRGLVRVGRGSSDKSWGKNLEPVGFRAFATTIDPSARWCAVVGTNAFQIFSLKTRLPISEVMRFDGGISDVEFEQADEFTLTTTNAANSVFWHRFKPEKEQTYRTSSPPEPALRSWPGTDDMVVSVPASGAGLEIRDRQGRLINTITPEVPVANIERVIASPDGLRLATIDKDRNAQLWDIISGRALGPPIRSTWWKRVGFTTDAASLLIGSAEDREFSVYDAWSGHRRRSIRHGVDDAVGPPQVFNRKGSAGLSLSHNYAIDGKSTSALHAVDLNRLQSPVEQLVPVAGQRGVVISDNGDSFVVRQETHGRSFVTCGRISQPELRSRFPLPDAPSEMFISSSGKRLATVHGFHRLCWWQLPEGTLLRDIPFEDRIQEVHLSATDERIITIAGTNKLACWSSVTNSGKDWVLPNAIHPDAQVSDIRISPDGRLLAVPTAPTNVRLVKMNSGTVVQTLPYPVDGKTLAEFAFSPSSEHLAVYAGEDLAVYETATGEQKARRPARVMAGRFSGAEDILALDLGKENGARLELWNWRTGCVQAGPFPLPWSTKGMALGPGGKSLAVNTRDQLQLFATDTGRQLADPVRLRLGEFVQPSFDSLGSPMIVNGLGRRRQKLWTEPEHRIRNRMAAERSGIIHRLSIPPLAESIPAWLPSFAEGIAGQRANSEGAIEWVGHEQRAAVRNERVAAVGDGYFDRLARWIYADGDVRTIVFGGNESHQAFLERSLLEAEDIGALYQLIKGFPASGRAYAMIALRLAQGGDRYWIPPEQRDPHESMEFAYVQIPEFEPLDAGQQWGVQLAIRWYDQQAAELDPNDPFTLALRAEVAGVQKNWVKALRLIDQALELQPGNIRHRYLHAFYRLGAGEPGGYQVFRGAALTELRTAKKDAGFALTEFVQTGRMPESWLRRLGKERMDGDLRRFGYSKIISATEQVLDFRSPDFQIRPQTNELQVLNRARGGNAQAFFEFGIPKDENARIVGARLELSYSEVKKPAPQQADLIAMSDWKPE